MSGEQTDGELRGLRGLRGRELGDVVRSRAWVILGLSGLAVAQPLLDLFGKNPEFFVAGNYSRIQIVLFALLIAVVPPLVGIGLTAAASFIDRRSGEVAFAIVVTVLAAALMLALLRTLEVDSTAVVLTLALVAGVGVALLVIRTRGGQLFASYLAAANLLFVGSFLFLSRTSELVAGESDGDIGSVEVPALRGPVVVVVLDELPAATIMRGDGSINAERYPGFAALAEVSTWFRNASSHDNYTHRARPGDPDRHARRRGRPTHVRRSPPQPVHPPRRRRTGPALRVADRPVPAVDLRAAAPPAAQPGARGRIGRVRPPGAAQLATRRAAGDRQLVGRLRRAGRRRPPTRSHADAAARRARPDAPRAGVLALVAASPHDERSPLGPGQCPQRRDRRDRRNVRRCTSSTWFCRTSRSCCRAPGLSTSYYPEPVTDEAPGLRVRGPPPFPAPQHASRRG